MPVNIGKTKRLTQMFQAECEWQGWWFFSKR